MKNLITFLFFCLPLCALAQKSHTVAAKESLYSIGRMYNVHPRELAAYNNLSITDGLNIGQVIKIPGKTNMEPLTENPPATTSAQTPVTRAEPAKTATQPVYHTVEAKEGLYSISKKYNATIAQIKQWNSLQSDNISIGDELIVGYSVGTAREPGRSAEVVRKDSPQQAPTSSPQPSVEKESKPAKPVVETVSKPVATATPVSTVAADLKGGYFKPWYDKQAAMNSVTQETGTAGVFKTTSGWEDGKYYCLHNGAPAGSIVKITNMANQRSVYAKVLDLIPDLRQNSSQVIRISNAAAAVLGVDGTEFNCALSY